MDSEFGYHGVVPVQLIADKGDVTVEQYAPNRDGVHGKFFVPIYKYSELEDKILKEDWNVRDIKVDGVFRTFLEVNFDIQRQLIKVIYNNRYAWISVKEWQTDPRYLSGWISHMKISPYFYTDDYGQNLIAGQLRFLELHMDCDLDVDEDLPETVNITKPVKTSDKLDASMQLLSIIYALGLTPKDAIKLLIDEV